ncbi:hypothetical protein [Microbacterium sp. RURRCA19A]|uniref:hypothetical protein n=1 Tax=Microbacterium sp. RURRCA19A TaxID=1907391 RepID=UPI0011156342|nr:hypothetical protein [Microbacterium sp. RURRCA19A]
MGVDNPFPEEHPHTGWAAAVGGAILQSIPFAGPIAATLTTEAIRQAHGRRVEEWAAMVSARLDSLERDGVHVDVTAPEFLASLPRLQRAANETADSEKRQLLALAAAHSGPWSPVPYSRRAEFVELVSSLTPAEISVVAWCDDVRDPDGLWPDAYEGLSLTYSGIFATKDEESPDIRVWITSATGVPAEDAWRIFLAVSARGLLEDPRAQSFPALLHRFTTNFGHEFVQFLRSTT